MVPSNDEAFSTKNQDFIFQLNKKWVFYGSF